MSRIIICSKDKSNPTEQSNENLGEAVEELSFFEREAVGKWSRYHAYDGSTDYYILKGDRTGCKWTQTSGGSRKSKCSFVYWGLDENHPAGKNVFHIIYEGSCTSSRYTSGDEFHYNEDEIWEGGYSNLTMTRSSTSKECE